jgi:archaemetzincin
MRTKVVSRPRKKLVIVPLGEVDYGMVNRLATRLVSIIDSPVDILQGIKIPQESFNPKRCQYYSTIILNKLELLRSSPREKILGIMDEDLYTPSMGFVLSEADPNAKAAIISMHRLKQQSLEIIDEEKLYFSRILKELVHNLGHLLNLKHCPNPKCVMHFSNTLLEIDGKSENFCDNCKRKTGIGFQVQ